jgi:type I restriction enzyme M protein
MQVKISKLSAASEEDLVRTVLKSDLNRRLTNAFAAGPRALADRYRSWADKYAVTLQTLETARDHANAQVSIYLKELGYV